MRKNATANIPDISCDTAWKRRFRSRLRAWFTTAARDLPWRRSADPYAVWISEMMLQQTQVATVIPYYQRFMARFPDVAALALADEEEVLRYWEGLGYYRRARALHHAAQDIVDRHQGRFPDQWEQVLALPGIGRYTAGAILSIAYEQRYPILEANTRRLFARLLAWSDDPRAPSSERRLWAFGESLLPRRHIGDFNQALMELGALVCTAKLPQCPVCPVASLCQARSYNLQDELPSATRGKQYEAVIEGAAIVQRRGKILLRQCQRGERWSGLWDFPRASLPVEGTLHRAVLEQATQSMTGAKIRITESFTTMKHTVTRYRIQLHCYRGVSTGRSRLLPSARWADVEHLEAFPLNVTARRIARLLQQETPQRC